MYHLTKPCPQGNDFNYCIPYNDRTYSTKRVQSLKHTIKVDGSGSVTARPDQAVIILGVFVEDENLQEAQHRNAVISSKVINSIKNLGIQDNDIQTVSYTINPMYDFNDGQKIFRGYEVQHMYKVIVKDISKVGILIDTAAQNGANVINSIEFTVSNPEIYYKQALQKATLDTIKKAEVIAKTLKVYLDNTPLQVTEKSTNIQQNFVGMPKLATANTITPIQEGQINIVSFVTAIFQYSQD